MWITALALTLLYGAGLAATLGSGAMTNPYQDVLKSKLILITGTNTTANHPLSQITFMKLSPRTVLS